MGLIADLMGLSEDEVIKKRQLTRRELLVLKLRGHLRIEEKHTLKEIGQQFRLSRERIRQIEFKALRKLRFLEGSELERLKEKNRKVNKGGAIER